MAKDKDFYAKGMIESGEEHFDLTPELDKTQYRMIKPYLGKTILEVGAGSGRISRILLKDQKGDIQYIVSEPSDHFFKQLSHRLCEFANVQLIQSETSKLKQLYPNFFDTIFSVDVMEHIEDDGKFLQECSDMLKPNGRIVILVPALQFLYSELDKNIGHYRRYDKAMMKKLAENTGLKIESVYYTNFLAIFASYFFLKLNKLDYQKNQTSKKNFLFLQKIYSRYFIPMMTFVEQIIPAPTGLNLTCVMKKV